MLESIVTTLSRIDTKLVTIERQSLFRKLLMWAFFCGCIPFTIVLAINIVQRPSNSQDASNATSTGSPAPGTGSSASPPENKEIAPTKVVSHQNLACVTIQMLSLIGVVSLFVAGHTPMNAIETRQIKAINDSDDALRKKFK